MIKGKNKAEVIISFRLSNTPYWLYPDQNVDTGILGSKDVNGSQQFFYFSQPKIQNQPSDFTYDDYYEDHEDYY